MKKSFVFIVLLLAQSLSMCIKSERYICKKDLEEEDFFKNPVACAGYIESIEMKAYYEGIGDLSNAQKSERNRDIFLLYCVEYLVEYEKCSHKSTIKPADIEL
ncbi:hypothetical protein [Leptonema illini]|uniref:Uncharacterized protein n=1 Tax=Leptonema illini DSM 21528 TaxID=929563 RepID=H2CH75_9LEPT|nr:hypothetical protein [Leptonema illini]EHQ06945.1 hypothetical protein Lepil_2269 [Leptonema illini DSM 21528]